MVFLLNCKVLLTGSANNSNLQIVLGLGVVLIAIVQYVYNRKNQKKQGYMIGMAIIIFLGSFYFYVKSKDSTLINESANSLVQLNNTENKYPEEQINFENRYAQLDEEVKNSEGNSFLHEEAVSKRSKFLESNGSRINNWVGTVQEVGRGFGDINCVIDCICYKGTHYQLQFNAPIEDIKKLKKGTKITFSGERDAHWSYITKGTFSIIN